MPRTAPLLAIAVLLVSVAACESAGSAEPGPGDAVADTVTPPDTAIDVSGGPDVAAPCDACGSPDADDAADSGAVPTDAIDAGPDAVDVAAIGDAADGGDVADNADVADVADVAADAGDGRATPDVGWWEVDPDEPATLVFEPALVSFGEVVAGETADRLATLRNGGGHPLTVSHFELRGAAGFSATHEDVAATLSDGGVATLSPSAPIVVPAGGGAVVALAFTASEARDAEAVLRVFSDDPAAEWRDLPLHAGAAPPDRRLDVAPAPVSFGSVPVGTTGRRAVVIESIGAHPVTVRRVRVVRDERAFFTAGATWAPPRVVPTGGTLQVGIEYRPLAASPLDADGAPIPHTAALVVESDATRNPIVVPIAGVAEGDTCPTAVLSIDEVRDDGGAAAPGTLLHLRGGESRATYEPIVEYRWTVAAPDGTRNDFWPSAGARDPTYRVDLAGAYRFRLSVVDAAGQESCVEAAQDVVVAPPTPIYVEVVWDTPGDPDPWDEGPGVGSDVDIHLAHPDAPADPSAADLDGDGAPDPWFDATGDCWAGHPDTDWGAALERTDVDGDGPEIVAVADPPNGTSYRLAVHYREDNDTGDVTATVRIHTGGEVALAWPDVALRPGDLWCVGRIRWPSGHVETCGDETDPDGARIVPDYPLPPAP